ncbi:MAG TPA: response regulator [Burkholderiaceae bacterium]|nr:response regulator [Burkholderiaceae bacterium]
MAEILVVDDEIGIRELLSEILGDEGHSVLTAENARRARELRDENQIDLVLLDIWMPDTDGVTLLKEWAVSGKLTMPVIMMSGHATIDTAVEATRIGALDFLEKPITMQKLLRAVETGLQRARATAPAAAAPATGRDGAASAPTVTAWMPVSAPGQPPAGSAPAESLATGAPANGEPAAGFGAAGRGVPAQSLAASITLRELPLDMPLREARDAFERAYFEHHLARENGSMTRVAERTGLERTHLYRKLKQLGIDLSRGAWRKQGGG